MVTGWLHGRLSAGVPPSSTARQLAAACAESLDLGLRTVQRALTDDRVRDLAAHLVAPSGTPRVPPAAKPQHTTPPPHPDDATDTSLLLGDLRFSPKRDDRWYTRQERNTHPGYCVAAECSRWIEPDEGTILLPYPRGSRVKLLCDDHSLVAAVELALASARPVS